MGQKPSLVGGACIIAGVCVGAGMLGLPSAGAGAWTIWSVLAITLTMIVMTLSGWMLLESYQGYPLRVSFDTVTRELLGEKLNALNNLTVNLAGDLGARGIRVNAVAPGITETDMMKAVPKEVIDPLIKQIPLRRLGQPEDIANAFVFLASDEASYITGVVLSVDGMART